MTPTQTPANSTTNNKPIGVTVINPQNQKEVGSTEEVQQHSDTTEENVYILYYRHGMNPQCQKGFKLRGDLKAAVERAKVHCTRMGYRYIFVRPLVSSLEDDEKYKDTYGAII